MASYTQTERGGCKVVFGQMPITAVLAMVKTLAEGAVFDIRAARLLGATMVVGMPADVETLVKDPDVLNEARARYAPLTAGLSDAAAEWFATGDRGASSEAMFFAFTGRGEESRATPADPSDLRRCRLLLEQVPEFQGLFIRMRTVSPEWDALYEKWPELTALMDEETPEWRVQDGSAPRTYRRMKDLGL